MVTQFKMSKRSTYDDVTECDVIIHVMECSFDECILTPVKQIEHIYIWHISSNRDEGSYHMECDVISDVTGCEEFIVRQRSTTPHTGSWRVWTYVSKINIAFTQANLSKWDINIVLCAIMNIAY